MLKSQFITLSIISITIFVLSFFIILKKLGYEKNKSIIIKIISLILIFVIIKIKMTYYVSIRYLFVFVVSLTLICRLLYKFPWKKALFFSSVYGSLYMIAQLIVEFSLLYVYIIIINKYNVSNRINLDLIQFIVFNFGVFMFTYKFDKIKELYKTYKYYIYIVFAIIVNAIVIVFLKRATTYIYDFYSLLADNKIKYDYSILDMPFVNFADYTLPYIVVVINVIFISLLINAIKSAKEESKIKVMNEKLDLQYNYYLSIKDSQDKVKKLYHDINNHISNIKAIQNDSEDVNKYIEDINNEIKDFESIYNTHNMILDTILNEKDRICKENNIDFICDLNFSKCSFIEMIDVTSIFSNLLENAIEACNKIVENSINKYIKIRGTIVKKYYVIRCENSKVNKVNQKNNKILTSKKDKFIHGIGIESIKSSLKKYNGELEIKEEENKFIATIYIPIN